MFNKIMKVVAALAVVATPVAASAQEAAPAEATYQPSGAQMYSVVSVEEPNARVRLVQPAVGLAINQEEVDLLVQYDCVIGPITTSRELYAWAERENVTPCSRRFYARADNEVARESMVSFRLTRVADGYMHCPLAKSMNLGNNRQACVTYPFNPEFNSRDARGALQPGRFADVNWAEGGETVGTRVLTTLGGALISGPGTALTAGLINGNPCGRGGCGSGVVNYVQASAGAVSESNASNQQSTQVDITGLAACATSGACGGPDPNQQ